MTSNQKIRIGIIGCGAVSEICHLPAIAKSTHAVASVLVDRNLERAKSVAAKFGVVEVVDSIDAARGKMDAAIVALPHHVHASATLELMKAGIHVLVEKPMAQHVDECVQMCRFARENRLVLAIGLMRRFQFAASWAKAAINAGILGNIQSFDIREGSIYNWPVASDFFFRKETAGGGVLLDTGAHTLDLMLWWLGDVASLEYFDDDYGGVEAESLLNITLASGIKGVVELSRTRLLRNTAIITGDRGTLTVSLHFNELAASSPELLEHEFNGVKGNQLPAQEYKDLFPPQLDDFIASIRDNRSPLVSGEEGTRSVRVIDECYGNRRPLDLPWMSSLTS